MNKEFKFTRREFLTFSGLVVLGGSLAVYGLSSKKDNISKSQENKDDGFDNRSTSENILSIISKEMGVTVPSKVSDLYSIHNHVGSIPNIVPDKEMALVLHNAVKNISGAGKLFQLLVPHPKDINMTENSTIPSGSYFGRTWPAFLDRRNYIDNETGDIIRDCFLDKKSMIQLTIPEGLKMTDVIDLASEDNLHVPFFMALAMDKDELPKNIRTYEYPSKMTVGERIRRVVAHEAGHGAVDFVRIIKAKGDMEKYWNSTAITLFGGFGIDVENPLLKYFAHINGWEAVSLREAFSRVDSKLAEEYLSDDGGDMLVWTQKTSVWGDFKNRKIRLGPYASYSGNIGEAFAEFYMASIYFPELLSKEEREFFGTIHWLMRYAPSDMKKELHAMTSDLPKSLHRKQRKIDKKLITLNDPQVASNFV